MLDLILYSWRLQLDWLPKLFCRMYLYLSPLPSLSELFFFFLLVVCSMLCFSYLELSLLPCWCFLVDQPEDSLQRLVMMTRGLSDPLASAYCRLYMAHCAQKLPRSGTGKHFVLKQAYIISKQPWIWISMGFGNLAQFGPIYPSFLFRFWLAGSWTTDWNEIMFKLGIVILIYKKYE